MQTFLPYPDFEKAAGILDYRRLGKQRLEASQILNTLLNGGGWKNHPAVKMWKGYEDALMLYRDAMIAQWIKRGFKNTMPFLALHLKKDVAPMPWWLGMERFHASHRSNLLRKDITYYKRFGWAEPDNLEYFWPV
jgi:hypothetical protein